MCNINGVTLHCIVHSGPKMRNCELWQHEKYAVPGLGFRGWADRFRVTPLGLPLYAIE